MYTFSKQNVDFAKRLCEKAINSGIVLNCKHTNLEVIDQPTGVCCFYIASDDIEGHKCVIRFFIENNLIRKTKTSRYYNISYKLDDQTRAGEYADKFTSDMRKIILGTDWWTDCDDAVALRLICRAVKDKTVELLGVGINACMEYSVASLKGFLLADGITDIPIGIDLDAVDYGGEPPYQKRLAEAFCPSVTNADAEDAVRLYRRLLAAAKEKVEIVEIGFLQVVADLLNSEADDISDKSGMTLVSEKVSKFWVMAGKWDADGERENNFSRNPRARVAGKVFCERCPVPVTFLGWEVACDVVTGGMLDKNDHLYHALSDFGAEDGRPSWDPMLVYMALIGDEEKAGFRTVRGTASVDARTGENFFVPNESGRHTIVTRVYGSDVYEERINKAL